MCQSAARYKVNHRIKKFASSSTETGASWMPVMKPRMFYSATVLSLEQGMKEHFHQLLHLLHSYEACLLSSQDDFTTKIPVHLQLLNKTGHLYSSPVG